LQNFQTAKQNMNKQRFKMRLFTSAAEEAQKLNIFSANSRYKILPIVQRLLFSCSSSSSSSSTAVINKQPCFGLLSRLKRRDPEVLETVMAKLQSPLVNDLVCEELDKVEAELLKAKQRHAADDACDSHVVVTVSMTTTWAVKLSWFVHYPCQQSKAD